MADQQRRQPLDDAPTPERDREQDSKQGDETPDPHDGAEGRDQPPSHPDRDRKGPWLGGG